MAFLAPSNLKMVQGFIPAAAASLTDFPLFVAREDMKIFYIDVIVLDSNASFTGHTITLEYDDNSTGDDTTIDVITVTTDTLQASVDIDDLTLTTGLIPAGSRVQATTGANFANISDGILVQVWYWPLTEN